MKKRLSLAFETASCFIRDEGRPFTYALQEEYVNHFMVL